MKFLAEKKFLDLRMKLIFFIAGFLFTPVIEAQYQNSLNTLKKVKEQIKQTEQQGEARVNKIEKDTALDNVQEKTEEDSQTQKDVKN